MEIKAVNLTRNMNENLYQLFPGVIQVTDEDALIMVVKKYNDADIRIQIMTGEEFDAQYEVYQKDYENKDDYGYYRAIPMEDVRMAVELTPENWEEVEKFVIDKSGAPARLKGMGPCYVIWIRSRTGDYIGSSFAYVAKEVFEARSDLEDDSSRLFNLYTPKESQWYSSPKQK